MVDPEVSDQDTDCKQTWVQDYLWEVCIAPADYRSSITITKDSGGGKACNSFLLDQQEWDNLC